MGALSTDSVASSAGVGLDDAMDRLAEVRSEEGPQAAPAVDSGADAAATDAAMYVSSIIAGDDVAAAAKAAKVRCASARPPWRPSADVCRRRCADDARLLGGMSVRTLHHLGRWTLAVGPLPHLRRSLDHLGT